MYASWEDTVVAFMAPRSGKTTAQAIPFVLSAPGPVIATSNKSDLWAATATLRAEATGGRVWLFDPQHITYQPQAWWWNLLDGLRTVEDAHRLAGHFVLTVADEHRRDLWGPAAQDLLAALFLAAAVAWAHPARRGRVAERARRAHPGRAAGRRRIHRHGGFAAGCAERRGGDAGRDLPDRADRGEGDDRPGDHGLGHPAAPGRAAGLRPGAVRGQLRHPLPAVEVAVRGGPADRRAVRHRDAGGGTPRGTARRAAGPAAGGAAG